MKVLVSQSCPALWDPVDCSPPGSSVHGILQARIWSGFPFSSPEDLPDPGIKPGSPGLQADSLPKAHQGSTVLTALSLTQNLEPTHDSVIKNLSAMQETQVQSLGREDPLE